MVRALLRTWWTTHVLEVRDETDAVVDLTTDRGRAPLVLVTGTTCLLFVAYFGRVAEQQWFITLLRAVGLDGAARRLDVAFNVSAHGGLSRLAFWGAVRVAAYLLVPMAVIRFAMHRRPEEFGWRAKGFLRNAGPYLVVLGVALPFVFAASFGDAFETQYPFYKAVHSDGVWPFVVAWWVIYAVQFVGVEFFFRGFLVLGLAPRFGYGAVFVAAAPYVMIHFTKPLPEAAGALVAAIALGTLILRSRSIWWGVAVHVVSAVLLDALVLFRTGLL